MKKNTREFLLDSAFQTFSKEGFQGANLSGLDINIGSLYHFLSLNQDKLNHYNPKSCSQRVIFYLTLLVVIAVTTDSFSHLTTSK